MKVLLTDASAEPSPSTMIRPSATPEGALETIAGERVQTGYVAESSSSIVQVAIWHAADVEGRDDEDASAAASAMHTAVTRMARALLGYENGSPIRPARSAAAQVLFDDTQATEIDRVPGLAVGDLVVIAAPAAEELVNTRARVRRIDGRFVVLSPESGDEERLRRSSVEFRRSPILVRRHCLEYAYGSRWARSLSRRAWHIRIPDADDPPDLF